MNFTDINPGFDCAFEFSGRYFINAVKQQLDPNNTGWEAQDNENVINLWANGRLIARIVGFADVPATVAENNPAQTTCYFAKWSNLAVRLAKWDAALRDNEDARLPAVECYTAPMIESVAGESFFVHLRRGKHSTSLGQYRQLGRANHDVIETAWVLGIPPKLARRRHWRCTSCDGFGIQDRDDSLLSLTCLQCFENGTDQEACFKDPENAARTFIEMRDRAREFDWVVMDEVELAKLREVSSKKKPSA